MDSKERTSKAAATKVARTQERIVIAFDQLIKDVAAKDITWAMISRQAGISEDLLYKPQHASLRTNLEELRGNHVVAQAGKHPRRRIRLSVTAAERIDELMSERDQLRSELRVAQESLNILSQAVIELSKSESMSSKVVLFPK